MASQKSNKPIAKPAKPKQNAASAAKLERLDKEIARLLQDRARMLANLAKAASDPTAVYGSVASGQDFEAVVQTQRGPLPADALRSIFRELNSACRAMHSHLRVAYLGPPYSYSHLAAIERFGTSAELVPVGSIPAVFEEVQRGHVEYGVVPLENSTDGRIADTLEMFTRVPVKICGEVQIRIHHYLLGKCPRSEVKEVYSRPQALSQCRNWLVRQLTGARTVEVTSTSTAAQLALEKDGAAAIASLQAATHYGLNVLADCIEDNPTNATRFAVLGNHSSARTGKDKTAVMFEIQHRSGALAETLTVFKRNRLNMTWIESFPISRPEGGYLFFVELAGHENDSKVKNALAVLARKTIRMEVLGSYATAELTSKE